MTVPDNSVLEDWVWLGTELTLFQIALSSICMLQQRMPARDITSPKFQLIHFKVNNCHGNKLPSLNRQERLKCRTGFENLNEKTAKQQMGNKSTPTECFKAKPIPSYPLHNRIWKDMKSHLPQKHMTDRAKRIHGWGKRKKKSQFFNALEYHRHKSTQEF